ncbi:MAG: colanic acid biosynthesis glycosyltransferase WcaL [Rhizorhabdus sp.]|nr:colanic acid biosynthesis glycosyltransferase WcaL [Rhizorhabdus sp.]
MKLAYLLNSYPMTSTTFIRREIAAIEAAGVPVKRFAVRHWENALVDPADRDEQGRTEYLLTGNVSTLLTGFVADAISHPLRLARAASSVATLERAARGRLVQHIGYLLQAAHLKRRCDALGITHVHAHFSTNAAAVAMLCRRLGGPAYSFTVHGPDELVDLSAAGIAQKARHAHRIVAITAYCRDRLRVALPESLWDRIEIIPCGLDLDAFSSASAGAAGSSLLCVGRLCAQKGQVEIPAAVAALSDRYPDLRVDLIGDGDMRSAIEGEIARLGLGDRIRLLGWRSNDDVRNMLRDARALLLPSHAEGLPIVIMEAFALRRPVITTRVAGIPELVDGSCGWLFDAGSADGLERAIAAALAADPAQLAAAGAEGRRRVEERHDLRRIAPGLIAMFAQP